MNSWHFFFSFAFYFVFCNYILTQLILYFLYSDEMVKLKWMQRNLTRQFIERILIWTVGIFFFSSFYVVELCFAFWSDIYYHKKSIILWSLNLKCYDSKKKFHPRRTETPFSSRSNDRQLQRRYFSLSSFKFSPYLLQFILHLMWMLYAMIHVIIYLSF